LCLLVFSRLAPQCLANPLDSLPVDVRELWLNEVDEAEPLFVSLKDLLIFGLPAIGGAILAFIISASRSLKTKDRNFWFISLLLGAAIALSVYQNRYSVFAMFLAVPILAVWVSELVKRKNKTGTRSLLYIPALALCFPPIWGIPGLLVASSAAEQVVEARETGANCYGPDAMEYLQALQPGRIAVPTNGAPYILMASDHTVLSGNYHRNADGILATLKIFTSEPNETQNLLKEHGIDYVYFCDAESESQLRRANETGLMARLYEGEGPNFLRAEKTFNDAGVTIYSVQ